MSNRPTPQRNRTLLIQCIQNIRKAQYRIHLKIGHIKKTSGKYQRQCRQWSIQMNKQRKPYKTYTKALKLEAVRLRLPQ